jgi:glycerol-3-phosphate acyltransferase PlsY
MIVDPVVSGLLVTVLAYLLGSLPTGYLVTKRLTGKDIRMLGSGNVGANNTWHEVGRAAGAFVGVFDFLKGVAAVALAHWLVEVPFFQVDFIVLGAALAVVAGQMWPVFLGFRGGNGLGTSIGVIGALLPVEMLVGLGLAGVFLAVSRNYIFSFNLSLLLLPFMTWIMAEDWRYTALLVIILVAMAYNFLPTARKAITEAGSMQQLLAQLFRRGGGR